MNNPIVVPMTIATDGVRSSVDLSADNVGVVATPSVDSVGVPMEMSVDNHGLTPSISQEDPGLPMELSVAVRSGGGGGEVTGVKGNAEATYRTGNVNLTADDIGIDLTGYVVDPAYVHTDNNFTDAFESKLTNLENLHIYVNGQECLVTLVKKGTWQNVPGIGVHYDDGTIDGGFIFVATSDTLTTFETYLDSKYATPSDIPTATSQLTNDSNFVVDANYVHTDNNYTTADATKLDNLRILGIGVSGTVYPIVTYTKRTVNGIEGISVYYDDGVAPDGVEIFTPDGNGITTVYNQLVGMMETFSISMSGNVISLTGSRGTNSSVTLPVYNGGYE